MKTFRIILATAVAALAFTACQKSEVAQAPSKTINFVSENPATKAAFGTPTGTTYPVSWTSNDKKFSVVFNSASSGNAVDVSLSADGIASFAYEPKLSGEEEYYQFKVVSPAAALTGNSSTKGLNIAVPTTQTPTAKSVDEAAMILYAVTEAYDALPEEPVVLNFDHYTAYGKVSILGIDADVTAIEMTAAEDWAGNFNFNPETGNLQTNAPSKTIVINTTSMTDNWFACVPVDLGGKTIKFVVKTSNGDYERTITLPEGKKFEAGKIAKFSVDFTGMLPKEDVIFTLVSDIDELTIGSEVIIVSKDEEFALSTTQKTNNRSATSIVKTGNTIVNPNDAVQILELHEGTISGTSAFYTGAGYLYAASSSSNQLKTQTELDANGSFSLYITESGSFILQAQGSNTRNQLCYNPNNGSPMFSCYASAQKDIVIYKQNGTGSDTPAFGEVEQPDAFETSLDDPASASEALAYAKTLSSSDQVEAYVKGTIYKIDSVDTGSYGNATYWISDDGTEANGFQIYRGYYLEGAKFTAENQIKVGDEVVVFGKIVNYKGTTPEMTSGSKIMSIN